MTETPLSREIAAIILIRDGGPLTIDRENSAGENALGVASISVVHALERKLLVVKTAGRFSLTVGGERHASALPKPKA